MKKTVRGAVGVAGGLVLTTSVLSGTAAAGAPPRCGDGPCEAVTLHNGKVEYLPYKAMPQTNWGNGLPAPKGTNWSVSDTQASAALGLPTSNLQGIYEWARMTNPALQKLPYRAATRETERRWATGFQYVEAGWKTGNDVADSFMQLDRDEAVRNCASGRAVCGFVGGASDSDRAPVISQSDNIYGPTKFTSTLSATSSVTHSKTEGWNIGGEVKGTSTPGPTGGAGGEASFTWGYNNSSTDTSSYTTSMGTELTREIEKGEWGYEEVRASATKYTGWMYIATQYPGMDAAAVGVVPMQLTLKAEGAVPPVNRMWITTKLSGKEAAEAKRLSTRMAKKYQQRNSLPAQQRKETEEWLAQAESRMRDLIDNSPRTTRTPAGTAR